MLRYNGVSCLSNPFNFIYSVLIFLYLKKIVRTIPKFKLSRTDVEERSKEHQNNLTNKRPGRKEERLIGVKAVKNAAALAIERISAMEKTRDMLIKDLSEQRVEKRKATSGLLELQQEKKERGQSRQRKSSKP